MTGAVTERRMLVLSSEHLLVRVDPGHGAEVLDLVDLATGRQLLGRPPFSSALARSGNLSEDVWTESYRGGWQTVLPNAGNVCQVEGEFHGFHGRASADPWQVQTAGADYAEMSWEGHGLTVTKQIDVGEVVRVQYGIEATRARVPLVAIEHLSVGHELLQPRVEIDIAAREAYELDERTGPVAPPAACAHWPEVTLLDSGRERADCWPIEQPRSRLMVLTGVAEGWCAIRNPERDQGLALSWDRSMFANCWIWHENRVSEGAWRGQTETLVVEPASVPHTLGLARAIDEGQACWLEQGQRITPWIVVRPCQGAHPVIGVSSDGSVRTRDHEG